MLFVLDNRMQQSEYAARRSILALLHTPLFPCGTHATLFNRGFYWADIVLSHMHDIFSLALSCSWLSPASPYMRLPYSHVASESSRLVNFFPSTHFVPFNWTLVSSQALPFAIYPPYGWRLLPLLALAILLVCYWFVLCAVWFVPFTPRCGLVVRMPTDNLCRFEGCFVVFRLYF